MILYLRPYNADASIVPRVYPVANMSHVLQARAEMARAYAASSSLPDCAKASTDSCCQNKGQISYKGKEATIMGKTCSEAYDFYCKKFKCTTGGPPVTSTETDPFGKAPKPVHTLQSRKSTLVAQQKTIEEIGKHKKGHSKSGTSTPAPSEDTTSTPTTDQPQTDTAGTPKDLFASIPALSGPFNNMFNSLCGSAKIPFVCQSVAYFEITVIVVVVVILAILFKKGRFF